MFIPIEFLLKTTKMNEYIIHLYKRSLNQNIYTIHTTQEMPNPNL